MQVYSPWMLKYIVAWDYTLQQRWSGNPGNINLMVGVGLHFTATLEWKPRQHQHSGRRRTTLYSNAGVETLSLTG